jgi:hypothetical protein
MFNYIPCRDVMEAAGDGDTYTTHGGWYMNTGEESATSSD